MLIAICNIIFNKKSLIIIYNLFSVSIGTVPGNGRCAERRRCPAHSPCAGGRSLSGAFSVLVDNFSHFFRVSLVFCVKVIVLALQIVEMREKIARDQLVHVVQVLFLLQHRSRLLCQDQLVRFGDRQLTLTLGLTKCI